MPDDAPLRVLIVDDELLARQRLEDLLRSEEDARLVGTAETGAEAVQAIRRQAPDLVFLDVQMPGKTGLDVVQEIGPEAMPVTIFVTAYDQYALRAFDLAALDYLLKPFDDERFAQALDRARQTVALHQIGQLRRRLTALLDDEPGGHVPAAEPPRYLERIAVDLRGQVRVVPVENIDFIAASGSYAELHVGEHTYLVRERMQMLEERLPPSRFFRIHRSTIVQLDRIEALLVGTGGSYAVRLTDSRTLKVSRNRREELEEQLGMKL